MSAARQWYYCSDGTSKFGPLTDQQLLTAVKEKLILPETLVWHAELSGWVPAVRIKALFPAEQAATRIPASAGKRESNVDATKKADKAPPTKEGSAGAPRQKSKRRRAVVAFAIIALIACGGSYYAFHHLEFEKLVALFKQLDTPAELALNDAAVTTVEEQQQTPTPKELSDEERRTLALAAIDELAAHPDDPHKPEGVAGVTDDALRSTSLIEVAELLELCTPYAYEDRATPRYLFALGRAALLHGMDSRAERLLTDAAEGGSIPAHAYLAFLTDDPREAAGRLNLAVIRGFLPAKAWLAKLGDPASWRLGEGEAGVAAGSSPPSAEPAKRVAVKFSYVPFKRPDLIKAFHTGEFADLPPKNVLTLSYVIGFLEAFNSPSLTAQFPAESRQQIHQLQDPRFEHQAGFIIAGNSEFVDAAAGAMLGSFAGMLKGMADVRRSGGSIGEETAAAMRSAGANSSLEIARAEGNHDAVALAFFAASDVTDPKRVMAGLKDFVVRVGHGERFGDKQEAPQGSQVDSPGPPSRGRGRGPRGTTSDAQFGRGSR